MKKICDSILDTIGGTPLVRINSITRGLVSATVLAKIETFNPGNSIKDRMAVRMIEDAERAGLLRPGGTITSGANETIVRFDTRARSAADVLGYDDGRPRLPATSTPTPGFSYPYQSPDGYGYPYLSPGGFSYPYFGWQEPPASESGFLHERLPEEWW